MGKATDTVGQTNNAGMRWRAAWFLVLTWALVLAFWHPLLVLISLGLGAGHDADRYSHIMLIPVICANLILRKRKLIFADVRWSFLPGLSLLVIGFTVLVGAKLTQAKLDQSDHFSALMASFVLLAIGNFVLSFGTKAFRRARFPLLMLALMIPFPSWFLDRTVSFLQEGSATVTAMLLNLTGMPFVREGLVFHLPTNLSIFIADDCSGIRSSIALLIASLVASDVFLGKGWTKLLLNLAVVPLSLFKNGVRIATLSLLSVYVDRRFISGDLHRDGGIVFYLIACGVLGVFLLALRKVEQRSPSVYDQHATDQQSGALGQAESPAKKPTAELST